MSRRLLAIAAMMVMASTSAMGSKPTRITYSADGTTDAGEAYSTYIVSCRNGKVFPITAWDNRRQWCVGEESRELCHKKQVKAAKAACKI